MTLNTRRPDLPTTGVIGAAVLLLLGPLLFGLSGGAAASAVIFGLVGIAVAIKPRIRPEARDPWIALATGAVIFLVPLIFGFGAAAMGTWLHIVVGAAFMAYGYWRRTNPELLTEMSHLRDGAPTTTS